MNDWDNVETVVLVLLLVGIMLASADWGPLPLEPARYTIDNDVASFRPEDATWEPGSGGNGPSVPVSH